jgi:hypothetical protein
MSYIPILWGGFCGSAPCAWDHHIFQIYRQWTLPLKIVHQTYSATQCPRGLLVKNEEAVAQTASQSSLSESRKNSNIFAGVIWATACQDLAPMFLPNPNLEGVLHEKS